MNFKNVPAYVAVITAGLLIADANAASLDAKSILAPFQASTQKQFAIIQFTGVLKVKPDGKPGFIDITALPYLLNRKDRLYVPPVASAEIALDKDTKLVIDDEAYFTLEELFKGERIVGAVRKTAPGGKTSVIINPALVSIYEKRLAMGWFTDIAVREGRVWVAELNMYGETVKKEMLLDAGESVTVAAPRSGSPAASDGGDGSTVSTPPPSPTPAPQPATTTTTSARKATVAWAALYDGGFGNDQAIEACIDPDGNVIVTGMTTIDGAGKSSIYTVKYDANGNQLWAKTFPHTGLGSADTGCAVAVDTGDNNSIVVGCTRSDNDYMTIKYDKDGNLFPAPWDGSVLYDTNGNGMVYGVAVDTSDQSVVVTGKGKTTDGIYTIKYDSSGTEVWHVSYPYTGTTAGYDVVVDGDRNIVMTGILNGKTLYTAKYASATGATIWEKAYSRGDSEDSPANVSLFDSQNGLLIGGGCVTADGEYKGLLVRYDTNGNELWYRNLAGLLTIAGTLADSAGGIAGGTLTPEPARLAAVKYTPAGSLDWDGSYDNGCTAQLTGGTTIKSGGSITGVVVTGQSDNGSDNDWLVVKFIPPSGSTLTKKVNRREAVIGDILTYTVIVHNPQAGDMTGITLNDRLPPGFNYVKGSSIYDSAKISDPTGIRILTYRLGGLAADESKTLTYQLIVGAGCIPGEYYNEASATGTWSGGTYTFNTAHVAVKVVLDPILQRGTIVGSVYWDDNENGTQEDNEPGIPGVKVYMEDGTSVSTDKYGRYHFQGVVPGTHIVKVDKSSIKPRE